MKSLKVIIFAILCALTSSCTDDFDEINTDKSGFTADEVSAKYFLTGTQVGMYAPARFAYWRAQLINADRYAGHATFGHSSSWWNDGLGYDFNGSYSDATCGWLSGRYGSIKQFADLTDVGGEFENEYMYAMSTIMKSLFFQMYTDTYGMVPYSEAGIEGILTPKYDAQIDVYKGVIAELDAAMATIGSAERTGSGINDVDTNDIYCGGDLQQWKRLANTLKLRIAMRAMGAPGENFSAAAISSALAAPLLDDANGSVVMIKDLLQSKWSSASYGDVWNDFGGGSDWTMGATLINYLNSNEDPRLAVYASPAKGGEFVYTNGGEADWQKRLDFIVTSLEASGADFSLTSAGDVTTISVPAGQYIGQPTRINGDTQSFVKYAMFSTPGDRIKQRRGTQVTTYPEIILTSAESYFLQAEAAVRGMSSGDAQSLFQRGIREAITLWGISGGAADEYIANQPLADISMGTMEEKLEKIGVQRWIAGYTDGFEAWAVVRDSGYPKELAQGVSDLTIFAGGNLNGDYPQRLRYGSGAQANPNYASAVSEQGPDLQATKVWYAK